MKKANIILASIAIFGVVGGALASKARKFTDTITLYCATSPSGNDPCSINGTLTTVAIIQQQYTIVPNGGGTVASGFCTFDPDAPCNESINVYTTMEE